MAGSATQPFIDYHNSFCLKVLDNVQYWQRFVKTHKTDVGVLDRERQLIVRAILFAFDLEQAWPSVCKLIRSFSPYMERQGHWQTWITLLTQAVDIAHKIEDSYGEASLQSILGLMLQRQGQVEAARTHHHRAITMAKQVNNPYALAWSCTNLGHLYIDQDYWYEAEILFRRALSVFEIIKDEQGRAQTETHLGVLYTRHRRWQHAQQHLERACRIWQATGDDHGLRQGLIHLGALYIEMHRFEEALDILEQALNLEKQSGQELQKGTILLNMAAAHMHLNALAQAEAYARQAEEIHRQFLNSKDLAQVWHMLGKIYHYQRKWERADFFLKVALEKAQELQNKHIEFEVLVDMYRNEQARGDHQKMDDRLAEVEKFIGQQRQDLKYRRLQADFVDLDHPPADSSAQTTEVE